MVPHTADGASPRTADEAQAALDEKTALDKQLQLIAGDFFAAVPAGAAAYVMKWILYDWDDAACQRRLGACRRAMTPAQSAAVSKLVIDPDRSTEPAYGMDAQMLVALGGKNTAAEFAALYDAAGLSMTRIIPTISMYCLVEGIPQRHGQDRP